jgi:hypothetical protein
VSHNLQHPFDEGIDMKTHLRLYTAIHDFCMMQRPVNLRSSNYGGGSISFIASDDET